MQAQNQSITQNEGVNTGVQLDPWVLSAGVAYRF
jgi:outer membrane protein W